MKITEDVLETFLKSVRLESISPIDPVVVHHTPVPWELVGCGNYAGVFCHPDFPDVVVKLYAPGREGVAEEQEVYRRLGKSPYFPICYQQGENYLVMKRMRGITLFDCVRYGIPIPPEVIAEVDAALAYARERGLFPQDIHGKNVLMYQGHVNLIDVSDYLTEKYDSKWNDLRRAYFTIYRPFLMHRRIRLPLHVLNGVRKLYRLYKFLKRLFR